LLSIILKNPQMAENVGTVARAMKNCMVKDLRIVGPKCDVTGEKARTSSSGAEDILLSARIYDTLPDAVADLTTVYATTARSRNMKKNLYLPEEAVKNLGEKAGIVFGCERTGLLNEDLALADAVINIPLNPEHSSLNLAQAVLIICYEYFKMGAKPYINDGNLADKGDLNHFFGFLESELEKRGYFHLPDKKPRMLTNLQNIFSRAKLTGQEVRTLHGVIKTLTKSKESNS